MILQLFQIKKKAQNSVEPMDKAVSNTVKNLKTFLDTL